MVTVQAVLLNPVPDQDQGTDIEDKRQMTVVTDNLQETRTDQRMTTVEGNLKMEPEMVKVLLTRQRRKNQPMNRVSIKITYISQQHQLRLKPHPSTQMGQIDV